MVSRFGIVDEEGLDQLKQLSKNENTKKSTEQWKNVFAKWVTERGKEKNLQAYECVDLDKTLSQFYAEVRKESGEDYEPDSLRVIQAALEQLLKSKLYPKSVIKDREFLSSRKVLEGKARKLREEGRGKEEETLWKSGQLGSGNPRALINTMWRLLAQHFGLREQQEHHNMKVEDFCLQRDDDGIEYLTYAEGPTKTRQGGLKVKP